MRSEDALKDTWTMSNSRVCARAWYGHALQRIAAHLSHPHFSGAKCRIHRRVVSAPPALAQSRASRWRSRLSHCGRSTSQRGGMANLDEHATIAPDRARCVPATATPLVGRSLGSGRHRSRVAPQQGRMNGSRSSPHTSTTASHRRTVDPNRAWQEVNRADN